ncbi:hypothetical protein [Nonomuraea soli]|uniref:Uncharacterized protein n=1 Tax=Nonomuraea soli TaxID=1032476 RepID=A0A7W0CUB1_9ACTN|nr:hypothetical protein [Nonomuraea soli]MBA2897372.1 hypothetical protein [Nonomuraea soli]
MRPSPREIKSCQDCHQSILWTTTRAGKRMAVDVTPVDDGITACYRDTASVWRSRDLRAAGALPPAAWETRHTPHVLTCEALKPVQEFIPGIAPVLHLNTRRRRRPRR